MTWRKIQRQGKTERENRGKKGDGRDVERGFGDMERER